MAGAFSPGLMWAAAYLFHRHKPTTLFSWAETPCSSQADTVSIYTAKGLMESVFFSKTFVPAYVSTRCHNPEEQHRHSHHHENLKRLNSIVWCFDIRKSYFVQLVHIGLNTSWARLMCPNTDICLVVLRTFTPISFFLHSLPIKAGCLMISNTDASKFEVSTYRVSDCSF
jgi:hypothetical protein